jgi:hypothetical protein
VTKDELIAKASAACDRLESSAFDLYATKANPDYLHGVAKAIELRLEIAKAAEPPKKDDAKPVESHP